jgi:hypothetical protein
MEVLFDPKLMKFQIFCSQDLVQNSFKLSAMIKLSIGLMMKSAENTLQFTVTLYFFNLAQIGPMTNADHH